MRPSKRVDILPPQASRQHGPRLLALAVCRVAANGQPERARPLPGAQGDIGRTRQIIAEGEQAGQEQLAERPAAYLRCASVKVMHQEYPAHLTFGVYELETLADRLAYGDRGLLVGLKPARDCIRARDGLAGLIAKPVDGRCDIAGTVLARTMLTPNRSACSSPTSAWRSAGRTRPKSTCRAASTCVSIAWTGTDGRLSFGSLGKPAV